MRIVFSAAALLLFLMSSLDAQRQYSFDLDVPAARSSFWKISDLSDATRLTTELEVREVRRDSTWNPTFQFILESDTQSIALLFVQEGGKGSVNARVRLVERGEIKGERLIEGWTVAKGKRVKLAMDWSDPGILALTSDGTDRGRYRLEFVPRSLTISASTGELVGYSVAVSGAERSK